MLFSKEKFGVTAEKKEVFLYKLKNKNGMEVTFTDYGASIVSIIVPDQYGKCSDVVLGYETLSGYEKNTQSIGSFVGRHANRIAGAAITIEGKEYSLEKNDGNNNLHSGSNGYNKKVYHTRYKEEENLLSIEFCRLSPDMEQGFPGNLEVCVTYVLTERNELFIKYHAVSDQATPINLTNHSYFNLAGHESGSVKEQTLWLSAKTFTPFNNESIPTGEIRKVQGTPMDFGIPKKIGKDIDADYEQLKLAGGYDHNFITGCQKGKITKVAELSDVTSKRKMEVYTDLPGIQIYTGNYIEPEDNCKNDAKYQKRGGICFETQFFPNSCNTKSFKSCIHKAYEAFDYTTVFKFNIVK